MDDIKKKFSNIEEYIAGFEEPHQSRLKEMRRLIAEAAPDAVEKISYQMPTFYLQGNLVHFAAFKNHIGFYPVPSGLDAFKEALAPYKTGKGSVQFPLDQPLPRELIQKIVRFRRDENLSKKKK